MSTKRKCFTKWLGIILTVILQTVNLVEPRITYAKIYPNDEKATKIVLLDPGHGGDETGTSCPFIPVHCYPFGNEKAEVLDISKKVAEKLQKLDPTINITMTRDRDITLSIDQRWDICQKINPDLFVSIHANAPNPINKDKAIAFTSQIQTEFVSTNSELKESNKKRFPKEKLLQEADQNLGNELKKQLVNILKIEDGGTLDESESQHPDGLGVLRCPKAPSALIEVGKIDAVLAGGNDRKEKTAEAIANAIIIRLKTPKPNVKDNVSPPLGEWGIIPQEIKTGNIVNLSAKAQDNFAGSGVKRVEFYAKYDGVWNKTCESVSGPIYSCAWSVPAKLVTQEVALSFHAIDNNDNKSINPNGELKVKLIGLPIPPTTPTPPFACPTSYTWKSEYYNNRYLSGSPTVCRNDGAINFDWGGGNPVAGIGADNFSVRWSGSFAFNAGNYTFIVRADDGVRVWVDGQIIIDKWIDQGPTEYRVTRAMSAGNHDIKMEYYENGGGAVAQLRWEALPTSNCPTPYTWKSEYYNNRYLSGSPTVCRNDGAINFDWGGGNPIAGIGVDNFSIRWSGSFAFSAGNYTFIARADDGVRVWVDGQLIIDKWIDQGATEYRVTRAMSAGNHEVKMEYYENGGGAVAQLRWEFITSPVPTPAPIQPPTISGPSGFIYCAKEGEVCNINGAKDVAYGTNGKYAYRSISGNFACNNQTFGDPIPGYQKGCFVKDGSSNSTSNRLIVRHSGMCADIAGVSNDNGAAIIQWDCNNSDNQQWRFDDVGGGYFKIVSKRNGKCLDATGGSNASAQPVVQWDCHGNTNQQWRLENVGNGDFRLIARSSNLCLDVNGQSKSGSARLIQWNCNGGQNQAWRKG